MYKIVLILSQLCNSWKYAEHEIFVIHNNLPANLSKYVFTLALLFSVCYQF